MAHTQEPWKFLEQGDADEYCIVTEDGLKWVIAFRINGEMMPDMQRANARRIVACVNACAGISNETLESGVLPKNFSARVVIPKLEQERNAAWEELRKIREVIKANPEESTFDEVVKVVSQRDKLTEALSDFVSDHENISDGTLNFGRAVLATVTPY